MSGQKVKARLQIQILNFKRTRFNAWEMSPNAGGGTGPEVGQGLTPAKPKRRTSSLLTPRDSVPHFSCHTVRSVAS
jgi:hypothetical protein